MQPIDARESGIPNQPRVCEWILLGFFVYTSALALILPLAPAIRIRTICANLLVLAILHCLSRWNLSSRWRTVRDLFPIASVLLAYQQMGWFAQPQASFDLENAWVVWDRLLLSDFGLKRAIELLGPVLPGLLELLYVLTYILAPSGFVILLACDRRDQADRFLALYAGSAVVAYALFPFFPSEPPRAVFPGELFPSYDTVFRKLNWWILGGAGIHTSVFPSGHVSSAFGCAFGLLLALPERRAFGVAMTIVACGISVATVYGRYHYAVDALAGLAVSAAVAAGCVAIFNRQSA